MPVNFLNMTWKKFSANVEGIKSMAEVNFDGFSFIKLELFGQEVNILLCSVPLLSAKVLPLFLLSWLLSSVFSVCHFVFNFRIIEHIVPELGNCVWEKN